MRMKTVPIRRCGKSPTRALLAAVVSAGVSVASGAEIIGQPARPVHVLTLFSAGASSGISVLKAWQNYWASKQPADSSERLGTTDSSLERTSESGPLPEPCASPQRR